MKRFYALLLPALFLASASFAQSNFKPGYVVTAVGDTLRGTIEYKEWHQNPLSIRFKDSNGTIKETAPGNTKGFGIDGLEQYRSFTLPVSTDEIAVDKLPERYDTTKLVATAFLRLITTGNLVSLYSYTDDIKTRYIATEKNNPEPVELSYHLYLHPSTKVVMAIERYKIELTNLAGAYGKNSAALSAKIQKASYDAHDLIKIVNDINGESAKLLIAKSSSGVRFFAGASLVSAKLTYSGNTDLKIGSKGYNNYFPKIGVGVDYLPNKSIGKLIFRGELNVYSTDIRSVSANATKEIKMFNIAVNPQVIFNFYNTRNVKAFLGAGLAYNFSSYSKDQLTITGTPNFTVNEAYSKLESNWYAITTKAGVTLNSIVELSVGYSPNTGGQINTNTYALYSANLSSLQFSINYLFGSRK